MSLGSKKGRYSTNTSELTSVNTETTTSNRTLVPEHPPPHYSVPSSSTQPTQTAAAAPPPSPPAMAALEEEASPVYPDLPYRAPHKTWAQRFFPNWKDFLLLHPRQLKCHGPMDPRTRARHISIVFMFIDRLAIFAMMYTIPFIWDDEYYYYGPEEGPFDDNLGFAVAYFVIGALQLWIGTWLTAVMDFAVDDSRKAGKVEALISADVYIHVMSMLYIVGIAVFFTLFFESVVVFLIFVLCFLVFDLIAAIVVSRPRPEIRSTV